MKSPDESFLTEVYGSEIWKIFAELPDDWSGIVEDPLHPVYCWLVGTIHKGGRRSVRRIVA